MQGLLIANKNQTERDQLASIFSDDVYQITTTASVADGLEGILNKTIQVIVLAGDYDEQQIGKTLPALRDQGLAMARSRAEL